MRVTIFVKLSAKLSLMILLCAEQNRNNQVKYQSHNSPQVTMMRQANKNKKKSKKQNKKMEEAKISTVVFQNFDP